MSEMANVQNEMEVSENKVVETQTTESRSAEAEAEPEPKQVQLVDVPITNENTALNVLVGFVNLAQKRGVFNVQESAKIWEAIQTFMKRQ
jgi:hypothetical protein